MGYETPGMKIPYWILIALVVFCTTLMAIYYVKDIIGKRRADRAYEFLKKEFPEALKNSTIHYYGQMGIRQTRWIVGKKQLIAEDVRQGIRFEDAIARTTWSMEHFVAVNFSIKGEKLKVEKIYLIVILGFSKLSCK